MLIINERHWIDSPMSSASDRIQPERHKPWCALFPNGAHLTAYDLFMGAQCPRCKASPLSGDGAMTCRYCGVDHAANYTCNAQWLDNLKANQQANNTPVDNNGVDNPPEEELASTTALEAWRMKQERKGRRKKKPNDDAPSYDHRDPVARRAYMRAYMAERRAREKQEQRKRG